MIATFMAYVITPWLWAWDSILKAAKTRDLMTYKESAAKLFLYHYKERVNTQLFIGRRYLHMYYIFVGFVVWLICQIVPFLMGVLGFILWMFVIGLVVTAILGI